MAWEMQHHMFAHIGPSIVSHLDGNCESDEDKREWLIERLEEYGADVYPESALDCLVDCLCDYVVETATTTNGAFEFYVDSEGYTTIPWCSDDEMLAFYG